MAVDLLFAEALDPAHPVDLLATVNGVGFRLVAEKVARDRCFAKARIRVSGRRRSALLASPYAPSGSRGNATQLLAQQIANEVLTVNEVGIDWGVDWGLADWLVPAGAWSHRGDTMAALGRIAEAAGGIIATHRTAQTLIMAPRYPVLPWEWPAVTPDLQLPAAAVARESLEWVDKPAYNAVYVSGESLGILGQATRAGDLPAPMVVDTLITAVEAATQRGEAILADTGRQLRQTLVQPEIGVVDLNTLEEFVDGPTTRRGLVCSVNLSASLPSLTQRPSRWNAVANLYALFRQLPPQSRLLVGDVVQTTAGGAVAELPDGSLMAVRGAAQIGDRAFLRDSVIGGPAPALPVVVIEE